MVNDKTLGERITVTGRIFDGAGALVRDAVIEIWQADSAKPLQQPVGNARRSRSQFHRLGPLPDPC